MSISKFALKRLTASDLTLFEWHFRNKNAGNQKAVNLNRNIFVGKLYPALPEAAAEQNGHLPLDLRIYGPDGKPEINLQRKIVKFGAYKNWRLNGEFIHNPQDDTERFNRLTPGDFAIFEFSGAVIPSSARIILVGSNYAGDQALHQALERFLEKDKMLVITEGQLAEVINNTVISKAHPVRNIVLDEALEDAVQGGVEGTDRLWTGVSNRYISREALDKARRKAEDNGKNGEQVINEYLLGLCKNSEIDEIEWTSEEVNPVSPYDFKIKKNNVDIVLDVKSTDGEFSRKLHISMNEIRQMANGEEQYDLYRVYDMSDTDAKVRIAPDLRSFAKAVLDALVRLPDGVTPNGFTFNPEILDFGDELIIKYPDDDIE